MTPALQTVGLNEGQEGRANTEYSVYEEDSFFLYETIIFCLLNKKWYVARTWSISMQEKL